MLHRQLLLRGGLAAATAKRISVSGTKVARASAWLAEFKPVSFSSAPNACASAATDVGDRRFASLRRTSASWA
jgi:hypothetical protein